MSIEHFNLALEPDRTNNQAFAARIRQRARRVPAPVIQHLHVRYRRWVGPPLAWSDDFGKKSGQVQSRDGSEPRRSCNEVEVAKRLRAVRDHAFWISSYSPHKVPEMWRLWSRGASEAPAWLKSFDQRVREIIRQGIGGIPDVVAWNDSNSLVSALFAECKGPSEGIKEVQEDWVAAAVELDIALEQIAVVVRFDEP